MPENPRAAWAFLLVLASAQLAIGVSPRPAPEQAAPNGKQLYAELKSFQLGGGSAVAESLTFTRDRVKMTFNGTFYFETPAAGSVYGAVFIGNGQFQSDCPPLEYEKENVRRFLKADNVQSDFRTAVLRFSDDSFQALSGKLLPGAQAPPEAIKLAEEFEPRFLKETAVNVSARLAVSVVNQEHPGLFLAQFDKGSRGRFTFVLDYQERIPVGGFGINAGEKGLIFAHDGGNQNNDVWMAFFSLEDFKNGRVEYSDANDLVKIERYQMDVEVQEPRKRLGVRSTMEVKARVGGLRAIPFTINEDLPEDESVRLKKALRLTAASLSGGQQLDAIQEDWEGGLTVFLPAARAAGETLTLVLGFEGNFLIRLDQENECYYPRETGDWYPQHGYLNRSYFDLVFHHPKNRRVVSVGSLVREEADPADKSLSVTEWRTDRPIALATFAMGDFETYTDVPKVGEVKVPVVFYSPRGTVKSDFVVAEMGNSLRYFSSLFGPYGYRNLNAVYYPASMGLGYPSLLLLPKADWAVSRTFQFISHEAAHQWWGDMVTWRSYRDQWLSEGFADYSGLIYTRKREDAGSLRELIKSFHSDLVTPAIGEVGIGKGPVANIGPMILGHRLSTRASYNGYTTLIYKKGALVLRMLHFLFTNPQDGNDKAFFDMMSDFVRSHQDGSASTDDFIQVANRHFAETPIAKKYRMKDLNWFFREWVYEAYLPTYRLEYHVEPQANGSVILRGTLYQDNTPNDWAMPLPLVLHFGKDKAAVGTILAYGPTQPVTIPLPARPSDVALDPYSWILSEKTSESGSK